LDTLTVLATAAPADPPLKRRVGLEYIFRFNQQITFADISSPMFHRTFGFVRFMRLVTALLGLFHGASHHFHIASCWLRVRSLPFDVASLAKWFGASMLALISISLRGRGCAYVLLLVCIWLCFCS
jgi:hypothetical protein